MDRRILIGVIATKGTMEEPAEELGLLSTSAALPMVSTVNVFEEHDSLPSIVPVGSNPKRTSSCRATSMPFIGI